VSSAFRQQEERRRAEREAQRREAALEAKREEARERAREEERDAQREAERREAARAEAEAERKAVEKAAARRAAALARRRAETAALRQEQARAARRAEERAAARQEERREQQAATRRSDRLEQERAEQRTQERREAVSDHERAEQRTEERRRAARDEERTAQRDESRAGERRQTARDEERAEQREQDRAEQEADERRQAARDERRAEEREQERREQARAEGREEERQRERSEQLRAEAAAQHKEDARQRERQTAVRTSTLDVRRTADREQARAAQRREAALGERAARGGGRTSAGGAAAGGRGDAGWLRVDRRSVVDERGAPVVLRGVTVRGLERPDPDGDAFAPALDADEAATLAAWGCTTITVPIAQNVALEGRGDAWGEDYLTALDATVATATSAGLRAIVQLSLLSSELPSAPGRFAPPVPDAASIDLWAQVARRYAEEPGVLFDLFATPHDPEPGDWTALVMPQLTWPIWERWVLAMLGEVKRVHPRALAIVRGLGGRDLSGFPLAYADGSRIPNLLYAAELAGEPTGPLAALRRLARRAPVTASPWRAGTFDGRVVETLGRRLANLGAHWTAAGWREPEAPLAAQVSGRLVPTALGRAFQVALAQPAPASSLRAPRVGPVRA
jgi:cellulase (glycosyl hydrolase family 5)